MHKDPLTDTCERIMIILSSLVMMMAISVYYLFITARYKVIAFAFSLIYTYIGVRGFVLKAWAHIYWKYLWECLYMCGLTPALTDEYLAIRKADLQATIDEMQYINDPQVMKAVAEARATLQSLEK